MAHSPSPIPATSALMLTGSSSKILVPASGFLGASVQSTTDLKIVHRRTATLGLVGALLGLSIGGDRNANAAGRRPPPLPPKEKQDPNLSGVQAKVLASKKRKDAMKEAVAKLREKGKPVAVDETPQ